MNDEHDAEERLKEQYAAIAAGQESSETGACGAFDPIEHAKSIGYSDEEMRSAPEGVTCLGCSNPIPLAELKEGETVLDLGSGGGLDAFLAARKVGERGRVIGIDMTAEMVAKATENANKGDYANVVFKPGEMENLPVEDESVDVVISNCVINHSSDGIESNFGVVENQQASPIASLIEKIINCIDAILMRKCEEAVLRSPSLGGGVIEQRRAPLSI